MERKSEQMDGRRAQRDGGTVETKPWGNNFSNPTPSRAGKKSKFCSARSPIKRPFQASSSPLNRRAGLNVRQIEAMTRREC